MWCLQPGCLKEKLRYTLHNRSQIIYSSAVLVFFINYDLFFLLLTNLTSVFFLHAFHISMIPSLNQCIGPIYTCINDIGNLFMAILMWCGSFTIKFQVKTLHHLHGSDEMSMQNLDMITFSLNTRTVVLILHLHSRPYNECSFKLFMILCCFMRYR